MISIFNQGQFSSEATMSYWSKITDAKTARDAAMQGVGASGFVAAVTGLMAILSIVLKHPVLGIDGWALVDAGLFGVIAWRTYKMSRPWALVGLLLYAVELAIRVKNGLVPIAGLVVAFVIISGFSNGVRGVFGFHRFGQVDTKGMEPLKPS
jgi:hypothetical protein